MENSCAWKMVVIIPKGDDKEFRVIGMVEVMCKATTRIINRWLTAAITYHSSLHGFQMGWCMGTAILKTKLLHQLTDMREVVLHTMLLDFQKVYDALE